MSSLFLKIVNMSIAASWLILAVILLRGVLKKAPKWINVLIWGAVAIRLLCPITIESNLSMVPSAEVFPNEVISGSSFDVNTGFNIVDTQINDYLGDHYFEGVTVPANNGANITTILSVVWIVGIFAFAIFAFVSYRKIHNKVRPSLNVRDNIWICDDIQTPFILGCFKPSIYIPSGTDEAQLPYIIAHENAHLKRCDHWWKPLGFLVLAIHWFNPLVWIAYIFLCRDIELACDEKVIRELNQSESIAYSEALLSCSVNRRTVMVCPLAFGEVGVKERVKRVLNYKKPAFWIVVVAVVASIILGVCFLTNPSGKTLTNWVIDEVDMNTSLSDLRTMTVQYYGDSVSCNEEDINRFISTMDKIKIRNTPVSQSRDEGRDKSFNIEINGNLCLNFTENFSEIWVDNGVKPSFSYPIVNPETAEELLLDFHFTRNGVDSSGSAKEWFDYLKSPNEMQWDGRLEINLPEFTDVTFRWYPEKMEAIVGDEIIPLYSGMPIWNTYFCDLTGDGLPELCSTITLGSGMIDSRIIIYDYAGGASYKLEDRGEFDYSLRLENDRIYVDKKIYNSDELVETGYLSFANGVIEIIKSDRTISTVGDIDEPQRIDITVETELDTAIDKAIHEHYASDKPDGLIHVESYALLANEAKSGTPLIGSDNHMEEVIVYLLVFHEKYSTYGGTLESVGGSYIPTAITFSINESDKYKLKEYWEPRDGSDYTTDIRAKFPGASEEDAFNNQAYIEELQTQNYNKALAYLNSTGGLDLRIAELLDIIQTSPATSSNPGDYIDAHEKEYQELLDYSQYTLRYCFSEFLSGGQTDLRGHLMKNACEDICNTLGEALLIDAPASVTGQDWFESFRKNAVGLAEQFSDENLEKHYPASWLLLQMIHE